jgi:hypothetical protein
MLILPNEWILDYLTPGTNKPHISEAFVKACRSKKASFLIRREGNFLRKLYRYSKSYSPDLNIGRFVNLNLRDFTMVRLVEEHEIQTEGLDLSTIPMDDRYLVEVLHSFPESVLISTDTFLVEQVNHLHLRAVLFQDDVYAALRRAEEMA